MAGSAFQGAGMPPQVETFPTLGGLGLRTLAHINRGDIIFTEAPIVSQRGAVYEDERGTHFAYDFNGCVGIGELGGLGPGPACGECMRSLGSMEDCLGPEAAKQLPHPHKWPQPRVSVRTGPMACQGCGNVGCSELFCSKICCTAALNGAHSRQCRFKENPIISMDRRERLAKYCSSLQTGTSSQTNSLWQEWVLCIPDDVPALRMGNLALLHKLTLDALDCSAEEAAWLDLRMYSDLLGSAGVNAMGIKPRSAFDAYFSNLRSGCGGDDRAKFSEMVAAFAVHNIDRIAGLNVESFPSGMAQDDDTMVATPASRRDSIPWYASRCTIAGAALHALSSKMNHDCDPSAQLHSHSFDDHTMDVVALKELRYGDELTISYVDARGTRAIRRAGLRMNYGFECNCKRCLREEAAASSGASDLGGACGLLENAGAASLYALAVPVILAASEVSDLAGASGLLERAGLDVVDALAVPVILAASAASDLGGACGLLERAGLDRKDALAVPVPAVHVVPLVL
eukprot:gene25761-11426_t